MPPPVKLAPANFPSTGPGANFTGVFSGYPKNNNNNNGKCGLNSMIAIAHICNWSINRAVQSPNFVKEKWCQNSTATDFLAGIPKF